MRQYNLNCVSSITEQRLQKIAGLLYDTDGYIYQDMFGSRKNAVSILPDLIMDNQDAMFSQSNIYVAEKQGEILGVLLWKKGELCWSKSELLKIAERKGIKLPSELDKVANEYVAEYEGDYKQDKINLLNLCVDEAARGKGVAKSLLQGLMSQYPDEEFELCVLADNVGAMRLYETCGFVVRKLERAYPKEKTEHFRYVMTAGTRKEK